MFRSALLPAVLLLGACGSGDPPPLAEGLVADLDGRPITLEEFQTYLDESLSPEDEPDTAMGSIDPGELDQVRSRLFDNFIDEALLAGEARRRHGQGPGAFQQLFNELEAEADPPENGEVEALVRERLPASEGDRTLVLRALMLPDRETADRVYDSIRRRKITFSEAVAAHESTPGQGSPMETSLGSLPGEVRDAVAGLDAGGLSRPVQVYGSEYLFLVEDWRDGGGSADRLELRAEALAELRSRRIQEATGRLLRDLRGSPKVRIATERLPFRYVPETEGQLE